MTALVATATFNLAEGAVIVAIVESANVIGYSAPSAEGVAGALTQVVPAQPPSSPQRGSLTDGTQLEVLYAAYPQDGGAVIEAYELEIDRGDGSGFVSAESPSLANSAIISEGIVSGATYSVRYRARNVHGWSESYSAELTIVAASVSSAPTDVETTNSVASATTVRVAWTAPADLGGTGIAITAYRILLRESDGSTFTESPLGSGCRPALPGDMAQIVGENACEVEMSVLRGSLYNLEQGALVIVKVQAQNVIGWSSESAINGLAAAQVETVPHSPSQAPTRGATASHTQLVADWLALAGADAGGSPIVSYALRYDDASAASVWTVLIGAASDSLALTYTVTSSISVGESYLFQYRAKNIHGWSGWSPSLTLVAASPPD